MILTPHNTWYILDSSKLQSFQRCERYVFFRHILGWAPDTPSIHLVHGEAWHRGMEFLLLEGYTEKNVEYAMQLYLAYYREHFNSTMDPANSPKTPGVARTAYMSYIDLYKDDEKHKVLYTEVAGSVSLGTKCTYCNGSGFADARQTKCEPCRGKGSRLIHFRLDSIVDNVDYHKKESWEHKTGSRNSQTWRDDWLQKIQIGTYTHAMYCLFGPHAVYGVRINGTMFYKSQDPAHIRIPVRRTNEGMQEWLTIVNRKIDKYEHELRILEDEDPSNDVMYAFEKNTEMCNNFYGQCEFFDYCRANPNPLKNPQDIPSGYHVEYWNPRDREIDATNVMQDNKIRINN